MRSREVIVGSECGGIPCSETLEEVEECNTEVCVIDCQLGEWSGWSECSEECGGGRQERERTVVREAENGGESCHGDLVEERSNFISYTIL